MISQRVGAYLVLNHCVEKRRMRGQGRIIAFYGEIYALLDMGDCKKQQNAAGNAEVENTQMSLTNAIDLSPLVFQSFVPIKKQ